MKYQERLFTLRDSDLLAYPTEEPKAPVRTLLEGLGDQIQAQMTLLETSGFDSEDDTLDRLYRTNHILAGMTQLYNVAKIDHLLEVLDFAFDLARSYQTTKVHSIDYLVKLFYGKILGVLEEFRTGGIMTLDLADLLEESRNYLLKPLIAWNQKIDDSLTAVHGPTASDAAEFEPAEAPPEVGGESVSVSSAPSPVQVPVGDSTPEVPFGDEPEPLQIPLDKVGMISDFFEENSQILQNFGQQVIEVEHAENRTDRINELFRMMHTVKGGARLLNLKKLEFLSHTVENLLDRIRKNQVEFTPPVVDILLDTKVGLDQMLDEVASGGPLLTRIAPLVNRIRQILAGGPPVVAAGPVTVTAEVPTPVARPPSSEAPVAEPKKKPASEFLRVSSEKLDEVLNTASEIYIGRIRFQNEITAIKNFLKSFKTTTERASEIEPARIMAKLDTYLPEFSKQLKAVGGASLAPNRLGDILAPMVGRLLPDNSGSEMSLMEELNLNFLTIEEIQKQLQKNLETLEQLSTRLQNGAMSFRMVPIANLFERFPLQLRDLARGIGKQVKMEIVGGDIELDKVLINKLSDPLLHMLRNSVDHGIEAPEDRVKAGKPETGVISLKTYYHGSFAVIEIKDDGKGLDRDRILAKGMEKGLVPEGKEGKLSDAEIFDLIFQPGFSTNETVTALSGRGVGMDVVKTSINQLHGSVEIESRPGAYTLFRLKLPLTLAIVKILLVQESFHQFALPILNIEALIAVRNEDIGRVGTRLIYNYQGQTIPVASLSGILDFPQSQFRGATIQMVVLSEGNRLTGILVDAVAGRQEVLIKTLGRFIKQVPFVMGCTILRDSKLVLILDPRQIAEAVAQTDALSLETGTAPGRHDAVRPRILVVDDSQIQRENLKGILKHTAYAVDTAENGFDALKICRTKSFAAFCVDIMMPLMDGYEFVERLRKMPAYQTTPVFLITAKDSDQHRVTSLNVAQVLKKPVDGAELVHLLDTHLADKTRTDKPSLEKVPR